MHLFNLKTKSEKKDFVKHKIFNKPFMHVIGKI